MNILKAFRIGILAAVMAGVGFAFSDLQLATGSSVGTGMVVFCPTTTLGAASFQLDMVVFCPF